MSVNCRYGYPSPRRINLKAAINALEQGRIDAELLKIKVKLAKNPEDYAVNNPNKKIGMLLGAKAGEVIWYFKTDRGKLGTKRHIC